LIGVAIVGGGLVQLLGWSLVIPFIAVLFRFDTDKRGGNYLWMPRFMGA
jgi:hypothetical protein